VKGESDAWEEELEKDSCELGALVQGESGAWEEELGKDY